MTYLARDGINTYYNPEDRNLYYVSLSDAPVSNHSSVATTLATIGPEPEPEAENNTSSDEHRDPYLARTEAGKISKHVMFQIYLFFM